MVNRFEKKDDTVISRGLMTNKSHYLFISLIIFIFSFPSICFSELKTVEGGYCDSYLGKMNDKKELDKTRKFVRKMSLQNSVYKLYDLFTIFYPKCMDYVISNYIEKVVVVSHTEKDRQICEIVKITVNPEVVDKYFGQENCRNTSLDSLLNTWESDIDDVIIKKNEKINIGIIIETKILNVEGYKRELIENEEENQFFKITERNKDKYKLIDRRHLSKVLEEQKLSSSGITDSETVKLGKILNLDVVVLRMIYENSRVTKVMKVDTGEVLLFKIYETEKKKEEGWVCYGSSDSGNFYYDKSSLVKLNNNVVRVWDKIQFKKESIVNLYELDCLYNTNTLITVLEYNDNGYMLRQQVINNPKKELIIPDSKHDLLRKRVCQ